MTNKELAKELLGYTYIDIQKIPEIYKMLKAKPVYKRKVKIKTPYESVKITYDEG